jgi:hypothetical protein
MEAESLNRKRISDKTEKREYRLQNTKKKKICKIKIDNALIKDNSTKKCDFLFLLCDKHIILVELKGSDMIKAIRQINSTIIFLGDKLKDNSVSARIVLSRFNVPRIENNPDFLKLKKLLRSKNGDLKYMTNILTENFDSEY